jgi:glycerophosphoryl diester phosphodiesterase
MAATPPPYAPVAKVGVVARRLTLLIVSGALLAGLALPAAASAVYPNPNPWLNRKFLNIAHQGGEDEAPSATMFALKSAMNERGADMLELDVNLTQDGQLVVMHDDTVSRTTNGPQTRPDSMVRLMDLSAVQALDAGYWFRPDSYSHDPSIPAADFPYRGIRTGAKPPPAGYTAQDFRIPTLREVLNAFPNTPMNIEIKMEKHIGGTDGGCTGSPPNQYCDDIDESMDVATALANLLNEPAYASRKDIIVVSFADELVTAFHALAPQFALAPGRNETTNYILSGGTDKPSPDIAVFQVPPVQNPISNVPEFLLPLAHADHYAVHVWPNDANGDTDAEYQRFLSLGIEGYMASKPGKLNAFLCAKDVPRPDGSDRCPVQKAKKCKKKSAQRRTGLVRQDKKRGKCKRKKKKAQRK